MSSVLFVTIKALVSNIFSLGYVLIGGGLGRKKSSLATLRINLNAKKLLPDLLRKLNLQVE